MIRHYNNLVIFIEIRFRDLTFGYPGGSPVLEKFELFLPAGSSLAIVGQNVLDDHHPEFGNNPATRKEIERAVYGKVTWWF